MMIFRNAHFGGWGEWGFSSLVLETAAQFALKTHIVDQSPKNDQSE